MNPVRKWEPSLSLKRRMVFNIILLGGDHMDIIDKIFDAIDEAPDKISNVIDTGLEALDKLIDTIDPPPNKK